jgi:hypothetical protein
VNARCLFESYCKHKLGKEVSNKSAFTTLLTEIEIVPREIASLDKEISIDVQHIIESLDQVMRSVGNLRNNKNIISSAHGGGSSAILLGEGYAYLVAGAVMSCINFISKTKKKN